MATENKRLSLTEMDGIRAVVRDLSRLFSGKTVEQECNWKVTPRGWDQSLGPWKNPTGACKDGRELLLRKISFLSTKVDREVLDDNLRNKLLFIKEKKFKELIVFITMEKHLQNLTSLQNDLAQDFNTQDLPECTRNIESQIKNVMTRILNKSDEPMELVESEPPVKKRKRNQSTAKPFHTKCTKYKQILPKVAGGDESVEQPTIVSQNYSSEQSIIISSNRSAEQSIIISTDSSVESHRVCVVHGDTTSNTRNNIFNNQDVSCAQSLDPATSMLLETSRVGEGLCSTPRGAVLAHPSTNHSNSNISQSVESCPNSVPTCQIVSNSSHSEPLSINTPLIQETITNVGTPDLSSPDSGFTSPDSNESTPPYSPTEIGHMDTLTNDVIISGNSSNDVIAVTSTINDVLLDLPGVDFWDQIETIPRVTPSRPIPAGPLTECPTLQADFPETPDMPEIPDLLDYLYGS